MSTYKDKAITDLKFIKKVLKTESAGGHDKQKLHSRFHYWLNTGYKQALKDIDNIKSYKAYRKVLSDYWYGFKDGHMVLRFLKPYKKPYKKTKWITFNYGINTYKIGEKQVVWISIPTFNPIDKDNTRDMTVKEQKYWAMKIIRDISKYRKYDYIVFDLRQNGGGDNKYADAIVRNLYTPKYLETIKNFGNNGTVMMRATPGNAEFWKNKGDLELANRILVGIEKGKDYVFFRSYLKTYKKKKVTNPVNAKILLLTNSNTGSTSLMFMDELLSLPNVYHIGQQTDYDTRYGESERFETVPSKLVEFGIPQKIRVGKWKRKSQPYTPLEKYTYKGDILSTKNVKEWIHALITTNKL